MGFTTSGGPRGLGQFTDAAATRADFNKLLSIVAEVANRRVGTAAEREALPAAKCFVGLEWEETDMGRTVVWSGATDGWTPVVPKRFETRFRRSDGALVVNNGTTQMRFETSGRVDTLGCTVGSDANGAFVSVPQPGLYWVTAELPMAFSQQAWGGIDIGVTPGPATILAGAAGEFPVPANSYALGAASRLIHVPTSTAKLYVYLNTSASGAMRDPGGVLRVVRGGR